MGTCNKKDGTEVTVLRNSTTLVMHMKVYDESIQQGERLGRGQRPPAAGLGSGSSRAAAPAARRVPCPPAAPQPRSLRRSWNQPLQPK